MTNLENFIKVLSEKVTLEQEINKKYFPEVYARYAKICSNLEKREEQLLVLLELQ
jgi:hypothetical protein